MFCKYKSIELSNVLKTAHCFFYYVHIKAHCNCKERIAMKDYFEEIIGYEDVKYQLRQIIDMLKNPDKYKKMGARRINAVLLDGEPGTGKTTFANCFIKATGRESFVVRKKKSNGSFLEEISKAFEEAVAKAPSIILLDDLDKFAEKDGGEDAEEYVTVQACLDEIRDKDVFVIATTNDVSDMPKSLLRDGRLGFSIDVGTPLKHEAVEIIEHYLKTTSVAADLDAESIARLMDGYSCATLESTISLAAMKAAYKNQEKIEMQNIVDACLDEIFLAAEINKPMSEDSLKEVAYHEAAHAMVAEILDPDSVSIVSMRKTRPNNLGFVRYYRRPKSEYTFDYIEKLIQISLAGKAATEIVFGASDMGANNDLHMAFDYAEKIVDSTCSFGFNSWIQDKDSDFAAENRNREMVAVMERNYTAVRKLLIENRYLLDTFAEALLKQTTLIYSDVQKLMNR